MTRRLIGVMLLCLALAAMTFVGCKKEEGAGGEGGAGEASGPNPFQLRKDGIEAYMKAVEDAADLDAAVAAGQAWIDANLASYTENCKMLVEYRQDLQKSKMADGVETPFDDYMTRLSTKAGDPMKAIPLTQQLNSFFACDVILNAPPQ